MIKPVLLLALVFLLTADQLVPLTPTEYGFSIGSKIPKLHIQFFLDFQCPDSRNSYYAWRNVLRSVDIAQAGVKLTFQYVPLQFHFYAFKIAQGFVYVSKVGGENAAIKYMDYVFDHQEQYSEEALLDYTLNGFLDKFSTTIAGLTNVNQKDLRQELRTETNTDADTRHHWKYSIGVHGISGAPIFNSNSVRIDGAEEYGYQDWVEFIKKWTK